jgi:hypothetical protein
MQYIYCSEPHIANCERLRLIGSTLRAFHLKHRGTEFTEMETDELRVLRASVFHMTPDSSG